MSEDPPAPHATELAVAAAQPPMAPAEIAAEQAVAAAHAAAQAAEGAPNPVAVAALTAAAHPSDPAAQAAAAAAHAAQMAAHVAATAAAAAAQHEALDAAKDGASAWAMGDQEHGLGAMGVDNKWSKNGYGQPCPAPQNNGKFTPAETTVVRQAIEEYCTAKNITTSRLCSECDHKAELKGAWMDIARRLPHRTVQSVYRHGLRQLHPFKRGPWSQDEVKLLLDMVNRYGKKWSAIQSKLHRSADSCRDKHREMSSDYVKGRWKDAETELLKRLIREHLRANPSADIVELGKRVEAEGMIIPWSAISKKMGKRSRLSCFKKWQKMTGIKGEGRKSARAGGGDSSRKSASSVKRASTSSRKPAARSSASSSASARTAPSATTASPLYNPGASPLDASAAAAAAAAAIAVHQQAEAPNNPIAVAASVDERVAAAAAAAAAAVVEATLNVPIATTTTKEERVGVNGEGGSMAAAPEDEEAAAARIADQTVEAVDLPSLLPPTVAAERQEEVGKAVEFGNVEEV